MRTASDCTVDTRKFRCNSTDKCIDTKDVCNGVANCPDGSDEGGVCGQFVNNTACAEDTCPRGADCFIWPTGPQCGCSSGYKYDSFRKICKVSFEKILFFTQTFVIR